jgi:hypothetical protein
MKTLILTLKGKGLTLQTAMSIDLLVEEKLHPLLTLGSRRQ